MSVTCSRHGSLSSDRDCDSCACSGGNNSGGSGGSGSGCGNGGDGGGGGGGSGGNGGCASEVESPIEPNTETADNDVFDWWFHRNRSSKKSR